MEQLRHSLHLIMFMVFQQLIKHRKERFADLGLPNDDGLYSVPIYDGDTISFTCEIAPNQDQGSSKTNESIPSKIYKNYDHYWR